MTGKIFFLIILFTVTSISQAQYSIDSTKRKTSNHQNEFNFLQSDSVITKSEFKPERILYELGAGFFTAGGAALVSVLPAVAISSMNKGKDILSGDDSFVYQTFVVGVTTTGLALGVYLAAKKFNKNAYFPNYLLAAGVSTTAAGLLAYSTKEIKYGFLALPLLMVYSHLAYPSIIDVNLHQQNVHGQTHNNLTLSFSF